MANSKGSGSKNSTGSKGNKYRSAITGRYVTAKHGKSSPRTTVGESPSARARRIKGELRKQSRSFDDSTEIVRRGRESG